MSQMTTTNLLMQVKARLSRRSIVFVLCLLLSGLFWLLTSLSEEYVDQVVFPIEYKNLPEGVLIENQPVEFVNAEVKGYGFDLLWHWIEFDETTISVVANPNSLQSYSRKGETVHYLVTSSKTGNLSKLKDDQIEVLKIQPDTLFFRFRPVYSKTVPVKLNADYTFVKQFDLGTEPIVEPDSIQISGLQSLVENIESIPTERIEWTDLDETVSEQVPLVKPENNRLVNYNTSTVQVQLNVEEFTEGRVSIPLSFNLTLAEDVNLYPNQVEIKYLVSLSDFEKITADMFEAQVTLNSNLGEQRLLMVEITKHPTNVKQPKAIPAQVEYILRK